MLLRRATLEGIRRGEVTLAFRRWLRPTVRAGGTLRTAIGLLAIEAVEPVGEEALDEDAAQAAGFTSAAQLRASLRSGEGGRRLYRVRLRPGGADPRDALRARRPDAAELEDLRRRLERMDARGSAPWTRATLRAIAERPGTRAADLARALGRERAPFKADVRKLKALGLTESLEVGYRLSARGAALLAGIEDAPRRRKA